MTTTRQPEDLVRIEGADELIQAIPYLLGFHPAESLVLVCLNAVGHIVLTARLDVDDARAEPGLVSATVGKAARAGAARYLAVVYTDRAGSGVDQPGVDQPGVPPTDISPRIVASAARLPGFDIAQLTDHAVTRHRGDLLSAFLVSGQRSWSYTCDRSCCPAHGRELPVAPSAFVARATVEGTVAMPDRATQAASLDPYPAHRRAALVAPLAAAERAGVSAVLCGGQTRHERSARRALFAAARASHERGWVPPEPAELARLAVALSSIDTRDALWYAIEDRRIDGRPLMCEIARSCPSPYDAAALFLYGWACWRAGNGMLAGLAASRALESSPDYTAAHLLASAVTNGLDPHSVARLRRPRRPRSGRVS